MESMNKPPENKMETALVYRLIGIIMKKFVGCHNFGPIMGALGSTRSPIFRLPAN